MKIKGTSRGITLIALVITIVVLLILAGVTIHALFGDNGLITKAQLSSFATEMKRVKENIRIKQNEHALYVATENITEELFTEEVDSNKIKLSKTFLQQVQYAREGYPSGKEPSDYTEDECKEKLIENNGKLIDIYMLDKDIGNNKTDTYVYDKKTDIVFKIPKTHIGGKVYHCYEIAQMQKGGDNGGDEEEKDQIIKDDSSLIKVGDETYYGPNVKGFNSTKTSLIYYSSDFSSQVEVTAKEYMENNEQYQIEKSGATYKLHDYGNKIWANAKTVANGLESWWVWIPRYAYKVNGTSSNPAIEVIYIDLNNNPLNTTKYPNGLPEGAIIHPAFTTEGNSLRGIWISKYEPSYTMQVTIDGVLAPDMTGFDENNTYIELYDKDSDSFTEEVKLSDANINTINKDKKWYDYANKIWANVKTNANGVEAWWVWIPRYAYRISDLSNYKITDIILVDLNDNPVNKSEYPDGLPEGYTVHSAFNVDGKKLQGIWMSKYEPSYTNQAVAGAVLAPDMTGFDKANTYIELYDNTSQSYAEEVRLSDANLSTINNEKRWYDYGNKIWANVKTNANGLESWWVWIPRYAYRISDLSNYKITDVIFVDLNDEPTDKQAYPNGLPEGYTVHPSFNVDGKKLQGIWMSKYEPSYTTQVTVSGSLEPDMSGFDKNHTYIELYDSSTGKFTEEVKLSKADLSTINKDKKWYDYGNKIWANVKTNANGLESWWVWIPRYAYRISDLSNYKITDVIFVDENNQPINKVAYPNGLPSDYVVHPAFNVDGKNLKGMWMSKYEPSLVNDIESNLVAKADNLPYKDDPNGTKHTHDTLGAGTTKRYVTSSTGWCDAYDGSSDCNNYGYYRYCSQCGVKLRYYWCDQHVIRGDKVWIDDSNIQ